MKKKYILILELEAEINETIPATDLEKWGFLSQLLEELLKNDRFIIDYYRLYLMADLRDGDHFFQVAWTCDELKDIKITDYIKPVLPNLPPKAREHFEKILTMSADEAEEYFGLLVDQFGPIIVVNGSFFERGES